MSWATGTDLLICNHLHPVAVKSHRAVGAMQALFLWAEEMGSKAFCPHVNPIHSALSSAFGTVTMSPTHLSMEVSPKGSLLLLDLPTELVCGTLQALFVLSLSNLIPPLASGPCCAWTNILSSETGPGETRLCLKADIPPNVKIPLTVNAFFLNEVNLLKITPYLGAVRLFLCLFERMNSILGQLCSMSLVALFKRARGRNTKGVKSFCRSGKHWPQMAFGL